MIRSLTFLASVYSMQADATGSPTTSTSWPDARCRGRQRGGTEMKRCEHDLTLLRFRDGSERHGLGLTVELTELNKPDFLSARCENCDFQLSLGPSNDEPAEVQVEMRAAEIERVSAEEIGAPPVGFTANEDFGWDMHMAPAEYTHSVHFAKRAAGYLARELATHDDRETRDADAWPWDPSRPIAEQQDEIADNTPMRAGAASYVGRTPKQIREQHAVDDAQEAQLRAEVEQHRREACKANEPVRAAADLLAGQSGDVMCEACTTADGCGEHEKFTCAACGKLTDWKDGVTDDENGEGGSECSDCWLKRTTSESTAHAAANVYTNDHAGDRIVDHRSVNQQLDADPLNESSARYVIEWSDDEPSAVALRLYDLAHGDALVFLKPTQLEQLIADLTRFVLRPTSTVESTAHATANDAQVAALDGEAHDKYAGQPEHAQRGWEPK